MLREKMGDTPESPAEYKRRMAIGELVIAEDGGRQVRLLEVTQERRLDRMLGLGEPGGRDDRAGGLVGHEQAAIDQGDRGDAQRLGLAAAQVGDEVRIAGVDARGWTRLAGSAGDVEQS